MFIRATTSPALTKSPSRTRISLIRPAYLAATSISVASMRPLPLARPSGPLPPAVVLPGEYRHQAED